MKPDSSTPVPSLRQRLAGSRRAMQFRHSLAALATATMAAGLVLLIGSLLNRISPWQESNAFILLAAIAILLPALLVWFFWKVWVRPVPLSRLAVQLETIHPEWMDSFICAVEQEKMPPANRSKLAPPLIEKMRRETAMIDFTPLLLPRHLRRRPLLALLGAAVFLAILAPATPLFQKALYHWGDSLRGEVSGLRIIPGTAEVPVGSDVTVEVTVSRWEPSAHIEYRDAHGIHRHPMFAGEEGFRFTFYSLEGEVDYRVSTPSLRSDWHRLSTYVPPAMEELRIQIHPPAYTRLKGRELLNLQDFTAVAGSRVFWEVKLPEGIKARWKTADEEWPFQPLSERKHRLETEVVKTLRYHLVLEDGKGRTARTPEYELTALPDFPPTIEITSPGRDTEAPPDAAIRLAALASDDFGLAAASLHLSISGERRVERPLFRADPRAQPVTERTMSPRIDLRNLEVEEGDVISYFITVTDNRDPDPQSTRSTIYFIEVREEVVPEEMDGQAIELEQIDLQALIVEMKRLIRLSWEALASADEHRPRMLREIATSLETVRLETLRIQQQVLDQAGEEGEPLAFLLRRAAYRMEEAVEKLAGHEIEESIPFQERALAELVGIQTELMKNQTISRESQPDASSGPSAGSPQESSPQDSLDELRQLAREVERLADGQAVHNTTLHRLSSDSLSNDQQSALGQRQADLRDRTREAAEAAALLTPNPIPFNRLRTAAAQMEESMERVAEDRAGPAALRGERARASLLEAAAALQEEIQQRTDNLISRLAEMAGELSRQQSAEAVGSRSMGGEDTPSPAQVAEGRSRQQQLQQELGRLLAEMNQTAHILRETHPGAAEGLRAAESQIHDSGVEARMARAANALLYRRFDRAAESQEEAAANLAETAEALEKAAEALSTMTRRQMEELLADIRRAQQEIAALAGQTPEEAAARIDAERSRLSRELADAGRALRDDTLREVSSAMGASQEEGPPNLFRMDSLLRAAARALEQRLFSHEIDRRARLQRQISEPPEQYRELVEEYFRRLSETP